MGRLNCPSIKNLEYQIVRSIGYSTACPIILFKLITSNRYLINPIFQLYIKKDWIKRKTVKETEPPYHMRHGYTDNNYSRRILFHKYTERVGHCEGPHTAT